MNSAHVLLENYMKLLAPRDVARRLQLSTSRVIQFDREGILRAFRDSAGRRFYDAEEVERFALARAGRRSISNER